MQKHQPLQAPNGIKVNHLHFHIFPRLENEPELFPVPQPNAFEGFYDPTESKVIKLVEKLKI
jgi:diadenosine tetraphosphate (Ap4A) HIT family hydrolase